MGLGGRPDRRGRVMSGVLGELMAAATRVGFNRLLAEFEPPPLRRVTLKPANATAVTRAIWDTPDDEFKLFRTRKSRSAVLLGSFSHLARVYDREEVVVALGKQHGRGARFEGLWRSSGSGSGVALSERVLDVIGKHLKVDGGEVVVVHNHVGNDFKTWWKAVFGWRPLPSSGDRDVAMSHNISALRQLLVYGRTTRLKWYLVDEGEMAEFYLPSVEKTLAAFESMVRVARATGGISSPSR